MWLAFVLLSPLVLQAQVVSDGSMGTAGPLSGPDYVITAQDGRQLGNNLFHSFQTFNLNTGESATFSGPSTIQNIVSRVTGGSPSWIDGTLRSAIPRADFYFINPSGVIFGANAALDVSGSFYVSTADYLKLGRDGRFDASEPSRTILTAADPAAFGFLNPAPAAITLAGSGSEYAALNLDCPGIQVDAGERIAIVGGNITIGKGPLGDVGEVESRLHAPGGRVDLIAVASSGELDISADVPDLRAFSEMADIRIADGSYITASGEGAGTIFIRAGNLFLDNAEPAQHTREPSGLYATTWGDTDGGGIDIHLRGDLWLTHDAEISSNNFGAGRDRQVTIEAGNIFLRDGGSINAFTMGSGDGSDVILTAREAVVIDNSGMFAAGIYSSTFDDGNAGAIRIKAPELRVINDGTITGTTSARRDSAGRGANIEIDVIRLRLQDGGDIETSTFGHGRAGNLNIRATESVSIQGAGSYNSGLYADTHGEGDAGQITLRTRHLNVAERGVITTDVTARAGDNAAGGDILLMVENLTIDSGGSIRAATHGAGPGGNITVRATNRVAVSNTLAASGENFSDQEVKSLLTTLSDGPGRAGSIRIQARHLEIHGPAGISALGFDEGTSGNVDILAGTVNLSGQHASINVSSEYGNSGDITIQAARFIRLDGQDTPNGATILASSEHAAGGRVHLHSPEITLKNVARTGVHTVSGQGGSLLLEADQVFVHKAVLFGSSAGTGHGGEIRIKADTITIQGDMDFNYGVAISNMALSTGDAGGIHLEADTLTINQGGSIVSSSHAEGNAGVIAITAHEAVRLYDGSINATTFSKGQGGDITLQTRTLDMQDGALIGAITRHDGDGGSIRIHASGSVRLTTSSAAQPASGIAVGSLGGLEHTGKGGDIAISTPHLYLANDARLDATTTSAGTGGTIMITASQVGLHRQAAIRAESDGTGDGGNIEICADNLFLKDGIIDTATRQSDGGNINLQIGRATYLENSQISTSVQGGSGHGGNIQIIPGHLVLHPGSVIANAHEGDGGNIQIQARTILIREPSVISASSRLGVDGVVNIEAPRVDLSGFSAPLTPSFREPAELYHDPCLAKWHDRNPSVFTVKGRDGSPGICVPGSSTNK